MEEENRRFADRYVEIEEENNNLANLYVASYQLHSTLDVDEVLKIILEIVINLVGAEVFGVTTDPGLGLLLELAKKGEYDPWDVDIVAVTDRYLQALDGLLTEITGRARDCDLIVLNAGVDPHADDRLGRLALSEDGLAQRDLMVFDWARDVAKPLCVVMGGGYDHRIDVIAERHARVYDRLFQAASRG